MKFRIFFLILLDQWSRVACLKDLKIIVPEVVLKGNDVTLSCQYDVEHAIIYQVKWYFGQREFYRFTPNEEKRQMAFYLSEIKIDLARSNETAVTLKNISRISGQFSCEVQEDFPYFLVHQKSAHLQVVDLPTDDSTLRMLQPMLSENYCIDVDCCASETFPNATFTWFINGQEVNLTDDDGNNHKHLQTFSDGFQCSILYLPQNNKIIKNLLKNPSPIIEVSITCDIVVYDPSVYHKTLDNSITFNIPPTTTEAANNISSVL